MLCVMLLLTGYEASVYYGGLVDLTIGMAVLIQWTWKDSAIAGVGILAMFAGVALVNPRQAESANQ